MNDHPTTGSVWLRPFGSPDVHLPDRVAAVAVYPGIGMVAISTLRHWDPEPDGSDSTRQLWPISYLLRHYELLASRDHDYCGLIYVDGLPAFAEDLELG